MQVYRKHRLSYAFSRCLLLGFQGQRLIAQKYALEYLHLSQYSDVIEVQFANFDYSVIQRGGTTHDFWNISVTIEEV